MEPQPSLAPRVAELLHVTLESQGITMEKIATQKNVFIMWDIYLNRMEIE
jgi:hypothetical protein